MNIYEHIELEATEILRDTWNAYNKPGVLSSTSFEEVLDAAQDVLVAKKIRHQIKKLEELT